MVNDGMPVPPPPAPPPVSPTNLRRVGGIVLLIFSALATPIAALTALLTANPCGAFGDACDDRGETTTAFVWSLLFLGLCVVGVVAGVALVSTSRRRQPDIPDIR